VQNVEFFPSGYRVIVLILRGLWRSTKKSLVKCSIGEVVSMTMQGKAHAKSSTEKSIEAPTIKKKSKTD
jgi:hypothetical protein